MMTEMGRDLEEIEKMKEEKIRHEEREKILMFCQERIDFKKKGLDVYSEVTRKHHDIETEVTVIENIMRFINDLGRPFK